MPRGFRRRATIPTRPIEKFSSKSINNRQDFENAISCVFEEDIANKSLGRKSRITTSILLDNCAFGKAKRNVSIEEEKKGASERDSYKQQLDVP